MYPNIEFSAYAPARFSVNIHTLFSVMRLNDYIDARAALTVAKSRIADLEAQGTIVTQAYIFDLLTGQLVLDLMPAKRDVPVARRVRRFIKALIGV